MSCAAISRSFMKDAKRQETITVESHFVLPGNVYLWPHVVSSQIKDVFPMSTCMSCPSYNILPNSSPQHFWFCASIFILANLSCSNFLKLQSRSQIIINIHRYYNNWPFHRKLGRQNLLCTQFMPPHDKGIFSGQILVAPADSVSREYRGSSIPLYNSILVIQSKSVNFCAT